MIFLKRIGLFLFLIIILNYAYPFANTFAFTGNFSIDTGILDYGFKTTRDETSKSIDRITIPRIKSDINFITAKKYQLTIGYSYDYILQSITYGGITLLRKNLKIGTGLAAGFYNELPLKLITGSYGIIDINLAKKLRISVYGYSSIFLKRLFSLESVTNDFDQNILNLALFYQIDYVSVGIKYNSKNLYKLISSGYMNNSIIDYQFEIKTDLKNSIINSKTDIGGNNSLYKTSTINNSFIQIYIDETIFINIKSFELDVGSRINILSFTLKDIKSTSPPKLPYLNFHAGLNYKFGK